VGKEASCLPRVVTKLGSQTTCRPLSPAANSFNCCFHTHTIDVTHARQAERQNARQNA
jgi:hypothetical protein